MLSILEEVGDQRESGIVGGGRACIRGMRIPVSVIVDRCESRHAMNGREKIALLF
jgi:hypothetical protein